MFGGVIIGFILDMPYLSRPKRALVGWTFTFVTGMAIMGGGLAFENWFEAQKKLHFIVSGHSFFPISMAKPAQHPCSILFIPFEAILWNVQKRFHAYISDSAFFLDIVPPR